MNGSRFRKGVCECRMCGIAQTKKYKRRLERRKKKKEIRVRDV